jgi:aminoglycoside 3-N-acetyltransferase
MRPLRNGSDYERLPEMPPGERRIYTPSTGEIDPTMGAVARAVVDRSGRSRGEHPLNSFAAVGPDSEALVGTQAPLDVYAPLGILADRGGFALLIGVGLTTMTLLHLAEVRAGREPFRRWANAPSGDVIEVQTGGCSGGFDAFEPLLARRTRETLVGESRWRAYAARETIEDAVVAIQLNPQITHCGNLTCERCRDAVVGGPLVAT